MKLKKYPFILLELLIAIGLLSLIALPFIDYPSCCVKKQLSSLISMELERIAEKTVIETKAKLYQNGYSFENLIRQSSPAVPDLKETITLSLPPDIKQKITQETRLWLDKQRKKSEEEELFLINIQTDLHMPEIFKKKPFKVKSQILIKRTK